MKVRSPINIHAESQIDRSTHNENLGEGSNEPIKGLRLGGLSVDQTMASSDVESFFYLKTEPSA